MVKNKILLVLVCSLLLGNNLYAQDKTQSIDLLNDTRCVLIEVKKGLEVAKKAFEAIHSQVETGLDQVGASKERLGKIRDDAKKQVDTFLNYFKAGPFDLSGVALRLACLDQVKKLVDSAIGIMSTIFDTMGVVETEFRKANKNISPKDPRAPIYEKIDIVVDRIDKREKRLKEIIESPKPKGLGGKVTC